MTSTKPYLVRAFNEWILDNQLTPYLLIDATYPNTHVPKEYVQEGRIVFNVTPGIISMLSITNEVVEFEARFSGRKRHIYAPMEAVLAIYAKENGQGMVFEPETQTSTDEAEENESSASTHTDDGGTAPVKPPKKGKPNLKIIK